MDNITGRLENWYYQPDEERMVGNIYNDTKGRFPDGLKVKTSLVIAPFDGFKEGTVISTLYSVYLLGKENI